jgi:hypothetical protein
MCIAMTDDHVFSPFLSQSESTSPLNGSVHDLYAVYFEIAKRDHACRRAALYGVHTPPPGHTPFRPLSFADFEIRFHSAAEIPDGEDIFRRQLARQAQVYGVEPVIKASRNAA